MLYAFAGYFLWVVVDTIIKLCAQGENALSPFVIVATLGLFGAAGLSALTLAEGKPSLLRPTSLREQAIIAACHIGISYANVIALKHLPLTTFYVVVFTTPLAIAILSAILKHETLTPVKISCLVVGFLGVLLAFGIRDGGDATGIAAGFVSVILFAIYTIAMRKISGTDTVESIQFVSALMTGLAGTFGVLLEKSPVPGTPLLATMLAAATVNILGCVLFNKAIQNTASTNVAQLHYTQIVSGAILGYVIWHEIPTWNLVASSAIIIVSGLVVAAQVKRKGAQL